MYRQIEAHLRRGISSGGLPPDTRLPAIRRLAEDLGVNRITVETAYAELESQGLVIARAGSGTYVLAPSALPVAADRDDERPWPLWQQEMQARGVPLDESTPEASAEASAISFAGGIGDPRLFPVEPFRKSLQTVLRRDGVEALEYGAPRGYAPLRSTIAHILASQGLRTSPENILITAGSQQALALIAQLLLRPGATILTESPTYAWALDLFRALGHTTIGIPVDDRGMQVDRLEALLQQHHPRLLYTIPNFQNPTGSCLSNPRRHELIALADRYNVPILEDDFVGDLRYDGRAWPALKALDPGGRVLYVSTFSKMLMPGLRAGFLVADGPVLDGLAELKRLNDLATSSLVQRALQEYVTVGRYQAHLRRSCRIYRRRRDAMMEAIGRYLPAKVKVHPVQGGLFLWLRLPVGVSSVRLRSGAREEGVDFMPGGTYFPGNSSDERWFRLNFAAQPEENIDEGIRRLARAVEKVVG